RSDYMNKNIKYSQNFLTSEKVLNQIIKQLNLKETDTVYEIGTGKGHLTTKLAKISKQVTSIELDSHLFNLSSEKLKLNIRVTLIHQDILQFQFPNKQRYKIVGSIPYHLSTQIIKKVVFESHASDIYLIVEEGFYKRTLDIHRTLGLLLHTQVSIQQLLKLPAECFHPKPKVNSVLIKLTRHTTDVPDKYWKLYTYFVSKWVNREYRQLFTKNQFHQAMKHAKVNNLSTVTYEQVLSIFNSYLLFNGRK
ncbi:rRNA adenine N-6-methyltransferase, partial [Enterococcus faecium 509]